MPLPPVPATGNPALDEYLKAISDALQRDVYSPLEENGGLGQPADEVDAAIQAATAPLQATIDSTAAVSSPIGTIVAYGGATAPTGWLLCHGQSVAKASYPALYEVIGGAFGQTDNEFTLPDLRGKVARGAVGDLGATGGADTVTLPVPSHVHQYLHTLGTPVDAEASFSTPVSVIAAPLADDPLGTDANVGAGDTVSVTNPYVALNYLIRAI